MVWPLANLLLTSLCPEAHVGMCGIIDGVFISVLLSLLTGSLFLSILLTCVEVAGMLLETTSGWSGIAGLTSEWCSRVEGTSESSIQDVTSLLLVLPSVEVVFNCCVAFFKSDCLGLDTESFTAVPAFLEPAGVGFLTTPEGFTDDFARRLSGALCLGPVLVGAAGECLEEDVEALTLDLDSEIAFVVFLIVEGLDISFSISFLGKAVLLEQRDEPSLDEA